MCGRFTLTADADDLAKHFNLDNIPKHIPRYNIAPSQSVLTLCHLPDNGLAALPMRWGLIPHWAKDPTIGNKMINARAETVHEKPSFRAAFKNQRCIIPADGFFEWQQTNSKTPHYIYLKEHGLFAFAGLWDKWVDMTGKIVSSCTIITTQANQTISALHPRMPVMLNKETFTRWLDPQAGVAELRALLSSYQAEDLQSHPVSRLVNNPSNDLPDCIDVV